MKSLKTLSLGSCVLSLMLASGCLNTEYNVGTHSQDLYMYSSEKEMAIGYNVSRQVAAQYPISANPEYIERINRIGRQLVKVCDRQELRYYFHVIGKDDKNAFALPGGYIYIFEGLFKELNDDELAFVLAHEIGHVVSRHGIKRLQAAMGYNLLVIASAAGSRDARFTQGVAFAAAQVMAAYSRQDEFNADQQAAKYCKLAGFDPRSGVSVMEKLYQASKDKINPISYFRTHPYPAQRIARIKTYLRMPLSTSDYINLE